MDALLYFGHITAMQYHRLFAPRNRPAPPGERLSSLRSSRHTRLRPLALDLQFLDRIPDPVHIYVGSEVDRMRYERALAARPIENHDGVPRGVQIHVITGEIPRNAYIEVSENVYVATPAMAFVQLAADLSVPRLAHVGCELTGRYAPDPLAQYGLEERVPLAAPADLLSMARDISVLHPNYAGIKKMRAASPFILPNARSPREVESMLLLSLPQRMGGYGVELPEFGKRIEPSRRYGHLVSQLYYECDLFYKRVPGSRISRGGGILGTDVEYQGKEVHAGRASQDSLRRDELKLLGVEMLMLDSAILEDRVLMDRFARRLKVSIGQRNRPSTVKDYYNRQTKLRREFFRD